MTEKFIELNNGEIVKLSDLKRITKRYSSKHTDDFEPFVKIKKVEPISKFMGIIPIKFAEKDCFKLRPFCNGQYGSWYNTYYYTLKDLFDAMIKHWGEKSPGAFGGYSLLPTAEYSAGRKLTENKNALYFDEKENAICVKPYLTLWFDDDDFDMRKFITFNNNEELNQWLNDNINCISLPTNI